MKVLLVGNYEADHQWSMDRYGAMLLRGLRDEGIETRMVRPAVVLGGRNKWLGYIDKFLLFRFALRREVKERPGWVVHVIDQGNGMYARWVKGCVVTCHDLLAIRAARGEFPAVRTGWSGRIFQGMILRGLREAGGIVCVSEATRRDAERVIGGSFEVIANGIEEHWKPSAEKGDYLLHVGGSQWYKNRAGLVRIFIALRAETRHAPKLIMVGPPLDGRRMAELAEAGLGGEVTVLPRVADDKLRELYGKALALVFPSIAEGCGWPILEAQACGCPVVARDAEPMRETGGRAAIYAGDGDWVEAIAEALEMDGERRAEMIEAGIENARKHGAAGMAREYVEYYRRKFE